MIFKEIIFSLYVKKWMKRRAIKVILLLLLVFLGVTMAITTSPTSSNATSAMDSRSKETRLTRSEYSPTFEIFKSDKFVENKQYSTLGDWQELANGKFNLGNSKHAIVRVTIHDGTLSPTENSNLVLFRNNIFTDTHLHTGSKDDTQSIKLQNIQGNNKVIATRIPSNAKQTTYYISLSGRYLRGQLDIVTDSELTQRMKTASALNAAFLGFVIVFIFLGILGWSFYKRAVFLLYSMLQASLVLWIAAGEGTLHLINQASASLPFFTANALGLLYFICLSQFCQHLLNTKETTPLLNRVLNSVKLILATIWCLYCISFNSTNPNLYQVFYSIALITCFTVLVSVAYGAIHNVKTGNKLGYFFLMGMSALLFGGLLAGLSVSAVIDYHSDWEFIKIATMIEMLCLAAGLMYLHAHLLKEQSELLQSYQYSQEQLQKTEQEFTAYAQDKENRSSQPIFEILGVFEKLLFVKAFGNYSIAYHLEGNNLKELLVDMNLTGIEEVLRNDGLIRCHKSYLVSTKKDFKLRRRTSADYSLALEEHLVPVGRKYQSIVKPIFG